MILWNRKAPCYETLTGLASYLVSVVQCMHSVVPNPPSHLQAPQLAREDPLASWQEKQVFLILQACFPRDLFFIVWRGISIFFPFSVAAGFFGLGGRAWLSLYWPPQRGLNYGTEKDWEGSRHWRADGKPAEMAGGKSFRHPPSLVYPRPWSGSIYRRDEGERLEKDQMECQKRGTTPVTGYGPCNVNNVCV